MLRLACLVGALALLAPFSRIAEAHDSHGTYEVGAAVLVTFADHDGTAAEGWAYTVLDPDGEPWGRGMCDALGRAVFAPDRPGDWKVRGYAPDGHGGEVVVTVDEDLAADEPTAAPGAARTSWIIWFMGAIAVIVAVRAAKRRIQG